MINPDMILGALMPSIIKGIIAITIIATLQIIFLRFLKKLKQRNKKKNRTRSSAKKINISFDKEESKSNPSTIKDNQTYLTVTEMAKFFKITPAGLNSIFSNLNWAYKKDKWWIATEEGLSQGAKQVYHAQGKPKYIKWNESIKTNVQLIEDIEDFQSSKKTKKISSKKKGELYEKYVAEHYRKLGYFVWEHGKEKGKLDRGIDLIVKKKKEIIFIQCKNWNEKNHFKLDHKEVKASRTEARAFMKDNPLFVGYEMKFRYILSGNFIDVSAIKYMEETNGLFDYEVLAL